jgi:hypothetical protein
MTSYDFKIPPKLVKSACIILEIEILTKIVLSSLIVLSND